MLGRFKRNGIEKTLTSITIPTGFFLTWWWEEDWLSIQIDRGDYHHRRTLLEDQLDSAICGSSALITGIITDMTIDILHTEMVDLNAR